MAKFHIQKTVNGFKVISLSKNIMEGAEEIIFEKQDSEHQMKDIQMKTEGKIEIETLQSSNKNLASPLECSECNKSFIKTYLLEHHMRVIHKKTQEEIVAFHEKMKLFKHSKEIRTVHEKKKLLQCSACEKTFKKEGNLKVHFETVHERKKRFECNTCGNKYTSQQGLEYPRRALEWSTY